MTELLERAMEAMRQMPAAEQDSMAQAILAVARGAALDEIATDHLPFVLEGLAQIERSEFATDEEVAEAFRSFEK
ncbi:hypothetical protein [Methylopila sp. M107]|uniref:hypothetical protein n=1 Tax=Methylopila sp. M107 TaxID=1101190 RepID=UPI0004784A39|nr:hypothetical protein [Methylopila sp. M107]